MSIESMEMELFKYMKVCQGVASSNGPRSTPSPPHCRHHTVTTTRVDDVFSLIESHHAGKTLNSAFLFSLLPRKQSSRLSGQNSSPTRYVKEYPTNVFLFGSHEKTGQDQFYDILRSVPGWRSSSNSVSHTCDAYSA